MLEKREVYLIGKVSAQVAGHKKQTFSVTKAVKALARERVGTPPPTQSLPDEKTKAAHRASKHKVTLSRLLDQSRDEAPVRRG